MNNLFMIPVNITNGFYTEILDILSFIAIICGILVVTNKNPIISVLYLIGLFLNIAGYLMILGMNFIGFSYLLVYIGAVSILFLFILMLINIRVSELTNNNKNSIPLAIFIGICTYSVLYHLLYSNLQNNSHDYFSNDSNKISYVTSNSWDGNLVESSDIASIGNILYTNYSMWLIITSIILLLAMIGAIVITTKQKK